MNIRMKSTMMHRKYVNPNLYTISEIANSLISRDEITASDELWLSLFSLRKDLKFHIEKIINEWKVAEAESNVILSSYSNLVSWNGDNHFKIILIEYLNRIGVYNDCNYLGEDSDVYIRLMFDKMQPESNIEKRKNFTKYVCDKLYNGYKSPFKLSEYTVNCYLGIVSGNSSSSRMFPRFEVHIHCEKEYPNMLDNCVRIITDFYFSKKRLELKKNIIDTKLGLEAKYVFVRNSFDQIPKEFLESVIMKLEVVTNASDESIQDLKYEGLKIDREYIADAFYKVSLDYINLLESRDFEGFMYLINKTIPEETKRKDNKIEVCHVVGCPCCGKKTELKCEF